MRPTGAMPNNEQEVRKQLLEWYQNIGFDPNEVSPEVFETTVRGWFHYTKNGTIPQKNVLSIVNFKMPRTTRRWFIFQIGPNAKMLRKEFVAHGYGSGNTSIEGARILNDVPEKGASERGFIKIGADHNLTKGDALYMAGLEQPGFAGEGVPGNIKTHSRKIRVHGGNYAKYAHSAGCLVVHHDVKYLVYDLIRNGTLVYLSDEQNHSGYPFMGGSGSVLASDIEEVPGTDHQPGPRVDPKYKGIESIKELNPSGGPAGAFNLDGSDFTGLDLGEDENADNTLDESASSGQVGNDGTPYNGSMTFQECQKRVCTPSDWGDVVRETNKPGGGNTQTINKFFSCGIGAMDYRLDREGVDPHDSDKADKVNKLQQEVNQCIALASTMDPANFQGPDVNKAVRYVNKDGVVICVKDSPEAVGYKECGDFADAVTKSIEDREKLHLEQEQITIAMGNALIIDAKKDAQVLASENAAKYTNSHAQMAGERSNQTTQAMARLETLRMAIPTRVSVLEKCRKFMTGKNFLQKETELYMGILDTKNKAIRKHPDPCGSVIRMGATNLVQNLPARIQGREYLEKLGVKVESLNEKEQILLNQSSQTRAANIKVNVNGGTRANYLGTFKASDVKKFGFGKDVKYGDTYCQGSDCSYSGGSGLKGKRSRNGKAINIDVTKFAMYSQPTSKGAGSSGTTLKFEGLNDGRDKNGGDNGVFQEGFYKNVYLALDGKFPVGKLNPGQRKEYDSLVEYKFNKNKQRLQGKIKPETKLVQGKKGLGAEIWFDKDLDLFKIISSRYRKVFSK